MAEPIILTDANLDTILRGKQPALILVSNGDGVRGEFLTAFKKAADDHKQIVFAKIDPSSNPQAAARFDVGSKPVLIGWANDAEVLRRNKPWGTDVPSAIDMLQAAPKTVSAVQEPSGESALTTVEESAVQPVAETTPAVAETTSKVVDIKPVVVTDATFEQEVLNHDLPVLVDFWAEWCGPCRMVAPILEKLAGEYAGKVRIAKVDTDANPGLSQAFRIMSIPTIMLIKERTVVFSQPGALPEPAFRSLLDQLITLEIPPQGEEQDNEETVPEELPAD
jgi:thioredoxin 1